MSGFRPDCPAFGMLKLTLRYIKKYEFLRKYAFVRLYNSTNLKFVNKSITMLFLKFYNNLFLSSNKVIFYNIHNKLLILFVYLSLSIEHNYHVDHLHVQQARVSLQIFKCNFVNFVTKLQENNLI